jgi:hypothetical protein
MTLQPRLSVMPDYMDSDQDAAVLARAPSEEVRRQAERLLTDGFVVIEGAVSPELCDSAVAAFRKLELDNPEIFLPARLGSSRYPRIVNLHLVLPQFRELFESNIKALSLQDFLFGDEACVYTSLFFEHGSEQNLHRDTPYFCTRPEYRYFGMWVALEDVDDDNGPLMVAPGGHRLEDPDRAALAKAFLPPDAATPQFSEPLWNAYQQAVADACDQAGLPRQNVRLAKGDTIVWHPQLPHGGRAIRDYDRTRLSVVYHCIPKDTPVYKLDAFLNPEQSFPTEMNWPYQSGGARAFVRHAHVTFDVHFHHRPAEFKGV